MSNKKPNKEEVRKKLKEFLQQGDFEDVASVIVHTLNHRAEKMSEKQKDNDAE